MRRLIGQLTWAIGLIASTGLADRGGELDGTACGESPPLVVTSSFPGGSARVVELDQTRRVIRIEPAAHHGLGWECWWYVHVSGVVPGETLRLEVGKAPWATPSRAAFSLDNEQWRQTNAGQRLDGGRIAYEQRVDADHVWFAWGPPYTTRHAQDLVARAAAQVPGGEVFELCRSRQGRLVPALRLAVPGEGERFHIWIQARQHAWEAGSSWVCHGLTEWLASPDERAVALRQRADVVIVPIMDVDNVEVGAGGKNQTPHDHNRDWSDQPHFPAVAAAQRQIRQLDQAGQFDLFIDLHNPDAGSQQPFFFVSPRAQLGVRAGRNLDRFLAAAREDITGPLAFKGQVRESDASYDPRWREISKNWVSFHSRDHVVAVTLETAWNTPHSTAAGYRTVGQQLGRAIERYLRTNPRSD